MSSKVRIDKLLLDLELAPSRERAQAYLLAGKVLVNEQKIEKAGTKVPEDAEIRILGVDHEFVSRGGLKLKHALKVFHVNPKNLLCMDIGASTGGFTDCLIQKQAAIVYAIDVGYGQLAWSLTQNPKVVNMERTNFRHLTLPEIGTFLDLIVVDASFISLELLLPGMRKFLKRKGRVVALVKPQFEAGKDNISKGGVVRDKQVHLDVLDSVKTYAEQEQFKVIDTCESPITGKKKGNTEFFIYLEKP